MSKTKKSLILFYTGCAMLPMFSVHSDAMDRAKEIPAWVEAKVETLKPTTKERRFDEIGWTNSIVEGERLGRQHNRPVFLFTQNGRIETGRT